MRRILITTTAIALLTAVGCQDSEYAGRQDAHRVERTESAQPVRPSRDADRSTDAQRRARGLTPVDNRASTDTKPPIQPDVVPGEVEVPDRVVAAAERHGSIVSVSRATRGTADIYTFSYEVRVNGPDGPRELSIREDGVVTRNEADGTLVRGEPEPREP